MHTPRFCLTLALCLIAQVLAAQPFTGNIPLPTLGENTYQGFQGGLYPGGSNEIPAAHAEAAREQAALIVPRDADGNPSPAAGLVGFITIGMSNATQEFKVFERFVDNRVNRHSRVVLVNTAQGGQAADVIADPVAPYWQGVMDKLTAAGLSPQQVQVAWIKQAQANPVTAFPDHAQNLQADLTEVIQIARELFPNLRIAFLSSRIYGGYSANPLRGEPLSYETGFAVKWLIEDQIGGNPALNFDPNEGPVEAPLLLWGPYIWADGINQSASGLKWIVLDFEPDGVHPSLRGELKVGRLLANFFRHRDHVRPWFDGVHDHGMHPLFASDDAFVDESIPGGNFGGLKFLSVAVDDRTTYLRLDASHIPRDHVLHAKLSLRSLSAVAVSVDTAEDTSWNEHTITAANAPAPNGQVLSAGVHWSRDSSPSFDLTEVLANDDDGIITVVLTREDPPGQELAAKESHIGRPALVISYHGHHRPDRIHDGRFEVEY